MSRLSEEEQRKKLMDALALDPVKDKDLLEALKHFTIEELRGFYIGEKADEAKTLARKERGEHYEPPEDK